MTELTLADRIRERAAELRRQAEELRRQAELQITAMLHAADEIETLLAPAAPVVEEA